MPELLLKMFAAIHPLVFNLPVGRRDESAAKFCKKKYADADSDYCSRGGFFVDCSATLFSLIKKKKYLQLR